MISRKLVGSAFVMTALALSVSTSFAGKPPNKANQCFACHGPKGVSMNPEFPSLAGQSQKYLTRQLNAFKSGDRKSQVMKPMVAGLSDGDIKDLADYFSSQRAGGGEKKIGRAHV